MWKKVRIGDVLKRAADLVEINAELEYSEITVRLWGKGVVLRGLISGAEISGNKRFKAKQNQLILSRIDARNGAIGVIPKELDGAVVTNDFPLFDIDQNRLEIGFISWLSKTSDFIRICRKASEGSTNRVRLKEDRFLNLEIPLPPTDEQRRIVAKIDKIAAKITEVHTLQEKLDEEIEMMLLSIFDRIIANSPYYKMKEVAPIERRPLFVDTNSEYLELGIRSFGKGTFHKPPISGLSVGSKRLFEIWPKDLIFSNVFAWEGAVAVVKEEDRGRCGSHRFITCVPREGVCTSDFLCYYFLTNAGLKQLGKASPGGAGRNRTLGIEALNQILVPIPPIEQQIWFDNLQEKVNQTKLLKSDSNSELDALLPSLLDLAYKGEL